MQIDRCRPSPAAEFAYLPYRDVRTDVASIVATNWVRSVYSTGAWAKGSYLLASIPAGNTLRRIRFGWGMAGTSSTQVAYQNLSTRLICMGIVTVAGTGTETPPSPIASPSDPAPPLSRWLWWEWRAPIVAALDDAAGTVAWIDHPASEASDTRGQVLANVPTGDTLDVWASWDVAATWDSTGAAAVWVWASTLYETSA